MNSLRPYYPVFKFVAVFAGLYFVLSFLYGVYLNRDYQASNYPDPVTATVAHQVSGIVNLLGRTSATVNSIAHPSVKLFLGNRVVYRVIEGCNAVSVMILFASFILAFAKAWKKTIIYLLIGIAVIYVMNLIRLVLLAYIYADHYEYAHISHEVFFPGIIYGTVILLWLYWIKSPKKL